MSLFALTNFLTSSPRAGGSLVLLLPFFVLMGMAACGGARTTAGGENGETQIDSTRVYLRVNLVGYREDDSKIAIVFSHRAVDERFQIVDAKRQVVVHSDL